MRRLGGIPPRQAGGGGQERACETSARASPRRARSGRHCSLSVVGPPLAASSAQPAQVKKMTWLTWSGSSSTRTHVQADLSSLRERHHLPRDRGVAVDKVMRRAGHDMVQTTMGQLKQAEYLTGELGVPFGPQPRRSWPPRASVGPTEIQQNRPENQCRRRESNRRRSGTLRRKPVSRRAADLDRGSRNHAERRAGTCP